LVARLLFQEPALRSAVRRGHAVQYLGARLEHGAEAGPLEAERQVHVLEISPEGFRKGAHLEYGGTAVKGTRPAGAEHRAAAQVVRPERLTVATLASDPA